MRKILIFGIGLIMPIIINAQNFVDTTLNYKTVLLETLGGINCYFCPQGDAAATDLSNIHGDRLIHVNVHAGIFAEPTSSEPDYRSPYSNLILNQASVTTFPAAMINRRNFGSLAQSNGSLALGTINWAAAVDSVLNEPTPVNIAAISEFNVSSRQIKVVVETYFTADVSNPNRMYAALVLDSIKGPQEGGDIYNALNLDDEGYYVHRNLFFDYISLGLINNSSSAGSFRADTFYYNLADDFNGTDFLLSAPKVIVWIADSSGTDVMNAAMSEMTLVSDNNFATALLAIDWDADFEIICGTESTATATIENIGNQPIDSIQISYDILTNGIQGSSTILLDNPLPIGKRAEVQIPTINNLNNFMNSVEFVISKVNDVVNPVIDQQLKSIYQAELKVADSNNAELNILFDDYPTDISWQVIDETASEVVLSDSNYSVANTLLSQSFIAEEGHCYLLKINDSYGDGLCCGSGQGYFELRIGSVQIFRDDEFDFKSGTKFIFQRGVISVSQTEAEIFDVKIFPNPAKEFTNLMINSDLEADTEISIHNMYGQLIEKKNYLLINGENRLKIEMRDYSAGVYLLKIRHGQQSKTLKFTIVK